MIKNTKMQKTQKMQTSVFVQLLRIALKLKNLHKLHEKDM